MAAHKSILKRALAAAMSGALVGFCLACGRKVAGVDPDGRKCECPGCKAKKVYGAEELVLMLA